MPNTFRDPGIEAGELSQYVATVGSDPTEYRASSLIEHDDADTYRSVLTVDLPDEFTMTVTQTFDRTGGNLSAITYRAESRHRDVVVSREEGNFSGTSHLQFGGKVQPFPTPLTPLLGGMTTFRGLDFRKGAKATVNLWLGYSIHWPVEVRVEKRTTVEVPAGRFDAWQVRAKPSFAHISGLLDKVVHGLLPAFTLHFDAASPHRLLRFSFPTGPLPWDPKGLVRLSAK
ncbi:hypothetical protein [Nocardia arthritidis]|uniref:DUF3108 domain-containing protein n=1 Tax=Nocardia arthritidis TaxID=228602 RepID=A0A6G9Y8Q5_9NOCA|nr:hypothetical protein [Nocardia arthritidis]QIS09436.1 hypothetical protein F5544_07670 [Nocardia arthritidis]